MSKAQSTQQVGDAAESITLYFKEGSSDKVYAADLKRFGPGWVVNFAYGRRGSTMTTGTKTSEPITFEKAKKIFDKLIAEKTGKGYTPGEDGTAYTATPAAAARDTGVRVQLLNEMSEEEVVNLLEDDEWGVQEKMDGRRQVVRKTRAGGIQGSNRKGLTVALADSIFRSTGDLGGEFTIDGEAVGDTMYVFDLLEKDGRNISTESYVARHAHLSALLLNQTGALVLVPLAMGTKRKKTLLAAVREGGGEGVVFKRLSAPYTGGRPNSGGDQLKYKFYATGSFIVAAVNAKRSVALKLADGTAIGNVTIPPNKEVPDPGTIVEVRYLYCYRGGSLYQPTFLTERDDIDRADCTAAQLKYRAEDEEGEGDEG